MKWSLNLGSVSGIRIYVHWTFMLLVGWILFVQLGAGRNPLEAARSVLFIIAIFGCITLHELGHALTAKRYGIRTRDITLLPIGGLARLERLPENPTHELWVALAGPAVNVAIAAGLYVMLRLAYGAALPEFAFDIAEGSFLTNLMYVNLGIVVFNLLPAFPMDGGRVLRALLAHRLDALQATRIASAVGKAMAIFFGFAGLLGGNPFLLFIALFVYLGADQELRMHEMRRALAGVRVKDGMVTDFLTLAPGDPLGLAIERLLRGSQQDFPVLEDGRVIGLLTRQNLIRALAEGRGERTVGEAMEPPAAPLETEAPLEDAMRRMNENGSRTLPVVREGRLVGLLTAENLSELLTIRNAMSEAAAR